MKSHFNKLAALSVWLIAGLIANAARCQTVPVFSRAELNQNDFIDWNQTLGPSPTDFHFDTPTEIQATRIPTPKDILTQGQAAVRIQNDHNGGVFLDRCPIPFNGNFGNPDYLLYNGAQFGSAFEPVSLVFSAPVEAVGAQIMPNGYGWFRGVLTAYDISGAVIGTTGPLNGFATDRHDDTALFLGIKSANGAKIAKVSFDVLFPEGASIANFAEHDFCINGVGIVANLVPPNAAPVITGLTPAPQTIKENGQVTLSGSFTDPDVADAHKVVIDWGDGFSDTLDLAAGALNFSKPHTYLDDVPTGTASDIYPVKATVSDAAASDATQTNVTVNNVAPTTTLAGPVSGAIFPINTLVHFTGSFTDPGTKDTHGANWNFKSATKELNVPVSGPGSGLAEANGNGTVTSDVNFNEAGVYYTSLRVDDDDTGSSTADKVSGLPAFIVVYNPGNGYVLGGGWLNSPPGAYRPSPTLTGPAIFGFVAQYQKGKNVPTGLTTFFFKAGNMAFVSITNDWLVITGNRAQYRGTGTINGTGSYSFILTAIDGQSKTSPDRLRMKIWDKVTGKLVYDNQLNKDDNAELDDTSIISGGEIIIQNS